VSDGVCETNHHGKMSCIGKDVDQMNESDGHENEEHNRCSWNDDIDLFLLHLSCLVRNGDDFHVTHDCAHERELDADVGYVLGH